MEEATDSSLELWDYLVVGSGFGGSVAGLRLVEKGYRVLMLEKGRRLGADDFPKTNWDLKKWFWLPALRFRGLFKMSYLQHITALSGIGVGGGSLVYANTMPTPDFEVFEKGDWAQLADWRNDLSEHYVTAQEMMGVTENPHQTRADRVLEEVAQDLGRAAHFKPANVAVYFGEAGITVDDPYFGGRGPSRSGCTQCGACMTGCRFNAKNSLDKNYLYLAEKKGLRIDPDTEVISIRPLGKENGYEVVARRRNESGHTVELTLRSRHVVLAGGVLGTVELLAKMQAQESYLPALSPRLGHSVRTNSEVLLAVVSEQDHDMSKGIAIGSILRTGSHCHVEAVRYGKGSGFFRLLQLPHAPGSRALSRIAGALITVLRHPLRTLRWYFVSDWAKRTMILLYMRSLEGTLRLRLGRSLRNGFRKGLVSELAEGPKPSAVIPEASEIGRLVADKLDGYTSSMITEVLLGTPTTAHLLGGCPMGRDREQGVIDHKHRVFEYPGLLVVDGSAISGNLGVNPSLTILALAERAMSFIEPAE